jgi:hypothetical protein
MYAFCVIFLLFQSPYYSTPSNTFSEILKILIYFQNVLRAFDSNLHFLGARRSFPEIFPMDLWELLVSGDEGSDFI